MPPRTAFQIIHDELMLDGNARLNLATFVTTWMEPEAELLMAECASKNMIDKDEYPQTAEIERRCVNILARLWHAEGSSATGCSTTGSSEACMLGRPRPQMALAGATHTGRAPGGQAEPRHGGERPGLLGEVLPLLRRRGPPRPRRARRPPISRPKAPSTACDENTIGVVAVLGSTYDGAYEPVAEIAAALDALENGGGPYVPMHVDGASGAMVAPFLDPKLRWDFRVPRVQSINVSGHKFGLVYPGVGWILWRDDEALPDELVFKVNYLGGEMPTFALNFSRPGAQVVAQYFNFLRLGVDGYRDVQAACRDTAQWLAGEIDRLGPFTLMSRAEGIPVFAFRLCGRPRPTASTTSPRRCGPGAGSFPPTALPPALEDVSVLRVVVRNGFSRDLAKMLLDDLARVTQNLATSAGTLPGPTKERRASTIDARPWRDRPATAARRP